MIKSNFKILSLLLLYMGFCLCTAAQTLTIDEAWAQAANNYPAIKKLDLIKKATAYSMQNVSTSYLPQLSIGGQATYQSAVTKVPVTMPNIKEMSKDQYRIQADVSQLIYDGGIVKAQKDILKAGEAVQLQSIEVTMQQVKERVAELYFGILLFDEQLVQYRLRKETLEASLQKAEALLENGVNFKSNVNELKAEILNADMGAIEMRSEQRGFKDMLALMTGNEIADAVVFVKPAIIHTNGILARPELRLFEFQKNTFDAQKKKLQSEWMPKVSAFAQGGYGRPGLNMLDNSFQPFAIGGIRLSFPINSLYTYKNNLKIIDINKQQIDADKETFVLSTNAMLKKQQKEIDKFQLLMKEDDKLVALRQSITQAAQAQLDNNVITVTEFITKLNAEYLAKQTKMLHQLQLLKSSYNYQITSGGAVTGQ